MDKLEKYAENWDKLKFKREVTEKDLWDFSKKWAGPAVESGWGSILKSALHKAMREDLKLERVLVVVAASTIRNELEPGRTLVTRRAICQMLSGQFAMIAHTHRVEDGTSRSGVSLYSSVQNVLYSIHPDAIEGMLEKE